MHISLQPNPADKTASDGPWVDDSHPGELWISVEGPGGVRSSGDFDIMAHEAFGKLIVKMHENGRATFYAGKFGVKYDIKWKFINGTSSNVFIVKVSDANNKNAVIFHGTINHVQ